MKYFFYLMCILIFFCISVNYVIAEEITEADIQFAADTIMVNILKGMETNDYKSYSKNFSTEMKNALTEQKFEHSNKQIKEQLGNHVAHKYLGYLSKSDLLIVLLKGKFNKTKDDVLIKLVLSKSKEKWYVKGLWFQ